MRNRKTNCRRQKQKLNYGVLEPRQLLAVDLTAPQFAQVTGPLPTQVDRILNGGFEPVAAHDSQFYRDDQVDGWFAVSSSTGQRLNLLEVQGGHGFVLELDSTARDIDAVAQDIDTIAGADYMLAFDMRTRPVNANAAAETNDVEVIWDGTSVGTFRATIHWQTVVVSVQGGVNDTTRLEFRELAAGNDGRGPLLDNVRLVRVESQALDNGGFETVEDVALDLHETRSVPGWSAMGAAGDRLLKIIQRADAREGSRVLQLDSSSDRLDRIYRDIDTSSNKTYYVTFDILAEGTSGNADNELRVRWGNEWVGTFQAIETWQTFGLQLTSQSTSTRLVFREPPAGATGQGSGDGPILDNIRIFAVDPTFNPIVVDANGTAPGVDATATYTEGAGPTVITGQDLILDNLTGDTISGAVVEILNLRDANQEAMFADLSGTSISADYDLATGILTLSGADSVENYQQVLRTITYQNLSTDPAPETRQVRITAEDNGQTSAPVIVQVAIDPIGSAPVIDNIADPSLSLGQTLDFAITATDPDDANEPLTWSISFDGLPVSGGAAQPTIDGSGVIHWTPEREGTLTIDVTATDTTNLSDTKTFTVTVLRSGDVPSDFVPFSGNRQLSFVTPSLRNNIYSAAPAMQLDANKDYFAVFHTADGEFRVRLFDDVAPITVNNFVALARDGFYDGVTFHRVVDLGPGFIAQGGDPTGSGSGGPGYRFDDEASAMTDFDRAYLLAMANSGPDTNGSQFFFTLAAQPHLNGRHAIFGEVVEGQTVVDAINQRQPGSSTPAEIIYRVDIQEVDP